MSETALYTVTAANWSGHPLQSVPTHDLDAIEGMSRALVGQPPTNARWRAQLAENGLAKLGKYVVNGETRLLSIKLED